MKALMLRTTTIITSLVFGLLAPALQAQTAGDRPAELSILNGWRDAAGHHMAAVQVDLAPGWKTYWRAPGDAGIPPLWTWTTAENVETIAFHWPVPQVSHDNGMRSIGYYGNLTLPVQLTATDPSQPIRISGSVQIGVCESICVPMEFQFEATLLPNSPRDGTIVAALLDRPRTAEEAGATDARCMVNAMDGGLSLTTQVAMPLSGGEEIVIETADPTVWVSEPVVERSATGFVATSRLYSSDGQPIAVDRSGVRITVLGGAHGAVDIRGCSAG